MINGSDESDQQRIQRGEQGKRSTRPSSERFLDNKNFDLRKKFRALLEGDDTWDGGGAWLDDEYMEARDWKIFILQDVREGIKK